MRVRIESNKEYTWDDIEYGEIFEYSDKNCGGLYVGMKVCSFNEYTDYILGLDTFTTYDDIHNYNFHKILGKIVLDEE